MVTTSGKPNAWYVHQELMDLWRTRVLLKFEPTWNPLFRPKFGNPFAADVLFFIVDKWEMSSFPVMDIW
jgi:hypothetical protein